jgi:hypothetical protein
VLLGVFPKRPRITWLIPLVWFVFAIQRARNASLFGIVAAIALADMLPHSRVGEWLTRREMLGSPRPSPGWKATILPMLAVFFAAVIQLSNITMPVIGRDWVQFDAARWPVELLPELTAVDRASEDGTPIFNDLNFGGFLIYHAPRLRIFIDDRCSLYGTEFLQAFDAAERQHPEKIDLWRRQYGFRYALVARGGNFDRYLAGNFHWAPLARAKAAILYTYRN